MNTSRELALKAVDSEREYQDRLGPDRSENSGTDKRRSTGEYLTMLRSYSRKTDDAWTDHPGDAMALHGVRKIAGIAVHCMEDNGVMTRGGLEFYGVVGRDLVYVAIDREREYQDTTFPDRVDHVCAVGDFLSLIYEYIGLAHRAYPRSQVEALHQIRKVAALAVACMEKHGAIPRSEQVVLPKIGD